jgi:hypothetical protein
MGINYSLAYFVHTLPVFSALSGLAKQRKRYVVIHLLGIIEQGHQIAKPETVASQATDQVLLVLITTTRLPPEETRALNAAYHQRIHEDQSNLIPLDPQAFIEKALDLLASSKPATLPAQASSLTRSRSWPIQKRSSTPSINSEP